MPLRINPYRLRADDIGRRAKRARDEPRGPLSLIGLHRPPYQAQSSLTFQSDRHRDRRAGVVILEQLNLLNQLVGLRRFQFEISHLKTTLQLESWFATGNIKRTNVISEMDSISQDMVFLAAVGVPDSNCHYSRSIGNRRFGIPTANATEHVNRFGG